MKYRDEQEKQMIEALARIPRDTRTDAFEQLNQRALELIVKATTSTDAFEQVNRRASEAVVKSIRSTDTFEQLNRRALEAVVKATRSTDLDLAKQLSQEMRALTESVISPNISRQIAALAHSITLPHEFQTSLMVAEVVKSINQLQINIPKDMLANIRTTLAGFNYGAVWAALETIRGLASEDVNSDFSKFVSDTLKEAQDLDKSQVMEFASAFVFHRKSSGLANEQLTVWLTILSLLIALYSAIQIGQPVKLDADQFAQFLSTVQQERNAWQPEKKTNYLVERACELKLKRTNHSVTIGKLFPRQRVRLLQMSHKWIYVEYFDGTEGLARHGWTYKKYLRRLVVGKRHSDLFKQELPVPSELSQSLAEEERLAITDNWEQTNTRRVQLINRKIENTITRDERRELERLQRLADERIRLFAPLPIELLKSALEDITRGK
jgi:hypothetical protein